MSLLDDLFGEMDRGQKDRAQKSRPSTATATAQTPKQSDYRSSAWGSTGGSDRRPDQIRPPGGPTDRARDPSTSGRRPEGPSRPQGPREPKQEPMDNYRESTVYGSREPSYSSPREVRPPKKEPGLTEQEQKTSQKRPMFSTPASRMKREMERQEGPNSKRFNQDALPSVSASQRDSFGEFSTIKVQMNSWNLDISRMEEEIAKILFQVTLVQTDGKRFELNMGLAAMGGDVNRQTRRKAHCMLFSKWFKMDHHRLFTTQDPCSAAYDAAALIYIPSSRYQGGPEEHIFTMSQKDFTEKEWLVVNRVSRRAGSTFEIRVKHVGVVYTKGPRSLEDTNRPELTRCLECVTNQILHNSDFLLYASAIYPLEGEVKSSPDSVTDIRGGFTKVSKVIEGPRGEPQAVLTLDTASSAFYKPMNLLRYFCEKMTDGERPHGGGGRGGLGGRSGRGGFQGRGGYHNDRRDRSRSPGARGDPKTAHDQQKAERLQRDFKDDRVPRKVFDHLRAAVKGLECEPIHLAGTSANNSVIIDGLHDGTAESCEFEMKTGDGQTTMVSVAKYYLDKYNIRLKYPHLPLVACKRRQTYNFYPMELMYVVPGQRLKGNSMSADIQSHMTGKNSCLPADHIDQSLRIMHDYLHLGANSRNPHMDAFKIRLGSDRPITTRAKILAPPNIRFATQVFTPDPSRGPPKIQVNPKYMRPAKIRSVVVINYDRRFDDVWRFVEALGRYCEEMGIREVNTKEWKIENSDPNDHNDTKRIMEKALKNRVTIVIGIVNDKRPEIHDVLKYYEEKLGQQTMQLTTETARKMSGNGGRQTIDNVMRKLNPKCGGTNFYVELSDKYCRSVEYMDKKLYKNTQFIGFEVSHTGSRTQFDIQKAIFDGEPTTVGVAYSLKHSAQLGGFSYYQDTRLHEITRCDEKLKVCLSAYEKSAERLPETIVVYRVGSGDGDRPKILEEVQKMRDAAEEKKKGYAPKFVVVLVQKHSHTRIFPEEIRRGQKAMQQNVPSGTCVEDIGSAHGLAEFVLCCQTPLIGTVRPTRYTIIVNDANWSKNELMNVTYQLAFGHQVSYAPPAVPNVLYAASNLAKRGHNNLKTHSRLGDTRHLANQIRQKYGDIQGDNVDELCCNDYIASLSEDINNMTISGRNFWA